MSNPIDPRSFFHDGNDEKPVEEPQDEPQNVVSIKQEPAKWEPPPTKGDADDVLRALPHAIGPEKSVLSVLLQYPEKAAEVIPEDFFYLPAHQHLYRAIRATITQGKELELVSLVQHLLDNGDLDRVGGPSAVTDIYTYSPSPGHFDQHLAILSQKHAARSAIAAANGLIQAIYDSPEESVEIIERATKTLIEARGAAIHRSGMLSRAYEMAYDPKAPPPADEVLMSIGDSPIAARGNLTGLQGKQKAGKSAIVASLIGAAMRGRFPIQSDTLGIKWISDTHAGGILHFDTEQSPSDWWWLVTRSFLRSGVKPSMDRLTSIPLVQFSRKDRLAIIEAAIADQHAKRGTLDLVILDGVADVCASPNDEEEALNLIARLMALCHKYDTCIVCIIHENPDSESGKTRGHLGSELARKAFANLRVDKDKDGVSTLYGTEMRKRDIPKGSGIAFAWNEEAKMHTVIGSGREIEAAKHSEATEKRRSKRREEDRTGLEDVFGDEDAMPYSELWPAIMDRFAVKERMAKTKISAWLREGLLSKNPADEYTLRA